MSATTPSTKDWEEFWQAVDALKVWSWKKDYYDEGVDDGLQWELKIKREGRRRRRIFGSNAYPEPRGTFNSFIKALKKLSKSKIEFEEEDFFFFLMKSVKSVYYSINSQFDLRMNEIIESFRAPS